MSEFEAYKLISTGKIYFAPYRYTAYRIDDKYTTRSFEGKGSSRYIEKGRNAIVFDYLKADFSSYGWFRVFVEEYGLEEFAFLDDERNSPHPLSKELTKIKEGKLKSLSEETVERFYKRVKDDLLRDQREIYLFYWQFVRKDIRPFMQHIAEQLDLTEQERIKVQNELVLWIFEKKIAVKFFEFRSLQEVSDYHFKYTHHVLSWKDKRFEKVEQLVSKEMGEVFGSDQAKFAFQKVKEASRSNKFQKRLRKLHGLQLATTTPPIKQTVIMTPTLGYSFTSLPARCFMELFQMVEDEKTVKECGYCGKLFVPYRSDEKFCSRTAPGYEKNNPSTCKDIAPQKNYSASLTGKKLEFRNQYKRLVARRRYLEKHNKFKEAKKIRQDIEELKNTYHK